MANFSRRIVGSPQRDRLSCAEVVITERPRNAVETRASALASSSIVTSRRRREQPTGVELTEDRLSEHVPVRASTPARGLRAGTGILPRTSAACAPSRPPPRRGHLRRCAAKAALPVRQTPCGHSSDTPAPRPGLGHDVEPRKCPADLRRRFLPDLLEDHVCEGGTGATSGSVYSARGAPDQDCWTAAVPFSSVNESLFVSYVTLRVGTSDCGRADRSPVDTKTQRNRDSPLPSGS